ncbi:serine/threonine protein kinase [Candidatus Sumerlaeota bacterium]|nr:serine/threonine protein kinase [Candidatus Sumerlaeota bacterium]
MGRVYRALDPQLDREVAIKIVAPPSSLSAQQQRLLRESLLKEGRLAARLNDRGIVQVYDVGEYENTPFIVLELIEGKHLRSILKDTPDLDFDFTINVLHGTLRAIAYAHSQDIVHLDLKPANIMVLPNGGIRVMDFGISKSKADLKLPGNNIMGSPLYMSPEQLVGMQLDARADVWSLGVVAYQMIAGALPFDGESYDALRLKILNDPPPMERLQETLDPEFCAFLQTALSKSADERFSDAQHMLDILDSILERVTRSATYTEGAIVFWPPNNAGVFCRPDRINNGDQVMQLLPGGKMEMIHINLNDQRGLHIGQLPRGIFRRMRDAGEWSHGTVAYHLFSERDQDRIPAAETESHITETFRKHATDFSIQRKVIARKQAEERRESGDSSFTPPPDDNGRSRHATPIEKSRTVKRSSGAGKKIDKSSLPLLVRGMRFSISFNDRSWNAVYWGEDLQGMVIAHEHAGKWSLMHMDLARFRDSLKTHGMMPSPELRELEKTMIQSGAVRF